MIPPGAAASIAERCRPELFDADRLAESGRAGGNPVEPLVRRLTELVGGDAAGYVHWGATSQDIMDSAAMLVSKRSLGLVIGYLDEAAGRCAGLAAQHRMTPMAARTLLQQAVPTTFGLKCAGWLNATLDARARLVELRDRRLAAQLGGAAGTLGALGADGLEVSRLYAAELGLPEPPVPWHADRVRIAELASALATAAGVAAKIGRDLTLLAQTEVGEVAEAVGGSSSTMPQKRNPALSVLAVACARQAQAQAGLLLRGIEGEHERAAGAWQAEWDALSLALAFTGGAVASAAGALDGLAVYPERMLANLGRTDGLIMAENVAYRLAPAMGRLAAKDVVAEAAGSGRTFRDALGDDDRVALTGAELDDALRPEAALGAAGPLVDRVLERFGAEGSRS